MNSKRVTNTKKINALLEPNIPKINPEIRKYTYERILCLKMFGFNKRRKFEKTIDKAVRFVSVKKPEGLK
jgi:hypothetical protein